jgi:hypothetical protein
MIGANPDWPSPSLSIKTIHPGLHLLPVEGLFIERTRDVLPPACRERYDKSGRRSKVLVKNLM